MNLVDQHHMALLPFSRSHGAMNMALALTLLAFSFRLASPLQIGSPETATYSCVQYRNNDFGQYYLNTCRLNGLGPVATRMTGWTPTGKVWPQFDCRNCNNATGLLEEKPAVAKSAHVFARQVNLTTSMSQVAAKANDMYPNDMYPCCYYSKPEHSYIEPMQGVGENPAVHPTCEGTFEGMTLFGSWDMDSMYNCIAFEYQLS